MSLAIAAPAPGPGREVQDVSSKGVILSGPDKSMMPEHRPVVLPLLDKCGLGTRLRDFMSVAVDDDFMTSYFRGYRVGLVDSKPVVQASSWTFPAERCSQIWSRRPGSDPRRFRGRARGPKLLKAISS